MFGDVAIAVNPDDNRYKPYWGCKFFHPFNGTEIPLVLDNRVDPSFGTGKTFALLFCLFFLEV